MATMRVALAALAVAASSAGAPAQTDKVEAAFEGEWMTLTGNVGEVLATSFTLDYGVDDVTVEMDRFDWAADVSLNPGDRVTVAGRIDENLYDYRTLEASWVFIPRLGEYLYADPTDDGTDSLAVRSFAPGILAGAVDGQRMSFSGRVVAIDGDEVIVDTGVSQIRVDTSPVPGDLMPPGADIGDRVLVSGEMDAAGLFDDREVEADSVVKITDAGR